MALTRFKRTLAWARLSVRELTHTLHLPPAHSELYGGPHQEWLRDILERLPRLQSLIVDRLSFFDHAALHALKYQSNIKRQVSNDLCPTYNLRLLDAAGCSNTTSSGIVEALRHLPALLSINLSRTTAARNPKVYDALRLLHGLRILKLQSIGLKDEDIQLLAPALSTRVRALDVRDNALTDASAKILLEYCFKQSPSRIRHDSMRRAPSPYIDGSFSDMNESEDLYTLAKTTLTRGFINYLAIEDSTDAGITHLYVADNCFTIAGVSSMLKTGRLYALDAGTIGTALVEPVSPGPSKLVGQDMDLPMAENLTPLLATKASAKLAYLRICHRVITEEAPPIEGEERVVELDGTPAVDIPAGTSELDGTDNVFELSAEQEPCYEMAGDTPNKESFDAITKGMLAPKQEDETLYMRRGSAFAPEPLSPVDPEPQYAGYGTMDLSTMGVDSAKGSDDSKGLLSPMAAMTSTELTPPKSPAIAAARSRMESRQSMEHHLHPHMLPKVRTLVLTDVPAISSNPDTPRRLIQFIRDCAEEHEIAKLSAGTAYALPPGRSRRMAEREFASSLFALKRIVLEVLPAEECQLAGKPKPKTSWRQYPSKSSTEDADGEVFWTAAENDFSFFNDEEDFLPGIEKNMPLAAMSQKVVVPEGSRHDATTQRHHSRKSTAPRIDVISELSRFRKNAKAKYEAAAQFSESGEPAMDGYWPGSIDVIRLPPRGLKERGHVDCYGNQFEQGYLYR